MHKKRTAMIAPNEDLRISAMGQPETKLSTDEMLHCNRFAGKLFLRKSC